MLTTDMILNFLKYNGPSLPTAVSKNIKENTLIASAYLGELRSAGKIEISKMKIGSSPLYYLAGQENQLVKFAGKVFSGRDYQVFERISTEKVLRERDLDLLYKVALRKMPDFTNPMQVDVGQGPEIFWRWYLSSSQEVNSKIRELLYGVVVSAPEQVSDVAPVVQEEVPRETVAPEVPRVEEVPQEQSGFDQKSFPTAEVNESSYPPVTTKREEEVRTYSYPPNTANVPRGDSLANDVVQAVVTDKKEEVVEEVSVETEIVKEEVLEDVKEQITTKVAIEPEVVVEEAPQEKETKKVSPKQETLNSKKQKEAEVKETEVKEVPQKKEVEVKEAPKSLVQKIKEKLMGGSRKKIGDFLPEVLAYFDRQGMNVDSHEVVRKNSEITLKIYVPSKVGDIMVFCKAKHKSRCDEKDISAAYMEAQIDKLPLLFLYTGTLSRKAEEFLESGEFVNLILLKLDLD